MEYDKSICPIVNVDGFIARGKQYDLDITLPDDNRNVIYGIVRDCYKEPICDAVVKLIEVDEKMGKEVRKPVSHTFTDEHGEFVFGPLCANRLYEVEIWVNNVKHAKICTECHRKGECLKGVDLDCKPMKPRPHKCDEKYEDEYDMCDKCDKCEKKEDKCDMWDKCDKCEKKEEKCDMWDKCDKCEKKEDKCDMWDKCEKFEKKEDKCDKK